MEYFDALNLTSICRDENNLVDKLAVAASTLQPSEELLNDDGRLEINSELVIELAFGKLDCIPKSFRSVVPMFGTVQNSPCSLEMLLAKTESSCTTCIGNIYICTHGKCKF